jgi:hypothetical protein
MMSSDIHFAPQIDVWFSKISNALIHCYGLELMMKKQIIFLGIFILIGATSATTRIVSAMSTDAGVSVKDYGAKGDGKTDDGPAILTAWSTLSTGILYFPAGTYRTSAQLLLKSGVTIAGAGIGATTIVYCGSGYWLDSASGTSSIHYFSLHDIRIAVETPATGALRAGRTSQDFTESYSIWRNQWSISNVEMKGPGAGIAGTIGMSVTQLIDHHISNLTILSFNQPAIIDRCGNGVWSRARFHDFQYGPLISRKAGTGSGADGASQDTFIAPEFLGPTHGSDGDTVTVDNLWITFINALYEAQPGGTSRALLHLKSSEAIGSNSAYFVDINGAFSQSRFATKTIVVDDWYVAPKFMGTVVSIPGFPPISFGTPAKFTESTAKFINCSSQLNALVIAADPTLTKSQLMGDVAVAGEINHVISHSIVSDVTGMTRILGVQGFAQPSPTTGRGLELYYADPGAQDYSVIRSYDRGGAVQKPLHIYSSNTEVNSPFTVDSGYDIRYGKRVLPVTAMTAFKDGTTAPSVEAGQTFSTSNTSSTLISNLTGGAAGQMVLILVTDANTTFVHSASFRLRGATDYHAPAQTVIQFWNPTGEFWTEVSRSENR